MTRWSSSAGGFFASCWACTHSQHRTEAEGLPSSDVYLHKNCGFGVDSAEYLKCHSSPKSPLGAGISGDVLCFARRKVHRASQSVGERNAVSSIWGRTYPYRNRGRPVRPVFHSDGGPGEAARDELGVHRRLFLSPTISPPTPNSLPFSLSLFTLHHHSPSSSIINPSQSTRAALFARCSVHCSAPPPLYHSLSSLHSRAPVHFLIPRYPFAVLLSPTD